MSALRVAFVLAVLALGPFAASLPADGASPVPGQSTTILEEYDIEALAEVPGACLLTMKTAPDGSEAYAYVIGSDLFFARLGSADSPIVVASGTVGCIRIDLAFHANGSAVVGWIDLRDQGSSGDGTPTNWDIYLAQESESWAETLITGLTPERVQDFRLEIDADGGIHLAYLRFTLAEHPYNPAIFYARSPSFGEVAVSNNVQAQRFDLALDDQGLPHISWDVWGDLMSVWYANATSAWTNVRVDTGQSGNWWDDRRNPSLAIDRGGRAHVVWVDARNTDPGAPTIPNRLELWHASSADGFVNSELVLPEDTSPILAKDDPFIEIDGNDLLHVAWRGTVEGASNLYYSNGTDWNRAVKITNRTAGESFGESFIDPPVVVSEGGLALLFSDRRTESPVVWTSAGWDFVADTMAPEVRPLRDRVVGISHGTVLEARGAWDNDRIVAYHWTFAGPANFSLDGYSVHADFPFPGVYDARLDVRDPIGLSASGNFSIEVRPEPAATGWISERELYNVDRAYGYLELHPWTDSFPLTFFPWTDYYSRHEGNGETILGPVRLLPEASREAAVFDDVGNLHAVGYEWSSEQLQYSKADRNGTSLIAPILLPLGGFLPQEPYLAYAGGRLWLAWMDQRDGDFETYLASLDTDGNLAWGPTRLSYDPRESDEPVVFANGGDLWIVWRDTRDGNWATFASVLDMANLSFRFSERRIGDGLPWDAAPDPRGGVALAIGVGSWEVQVQRVAADGTPSAPVPVSYDDGQPDWQADVDVDASGIVHVAWFEAVNGTALRFASVLPDDRVEPLGGLVLHVNTGDDLPRVAVRVGPDGEPRIAYTDGSAFTGATLYLADRDLQPPVAAIDAPAFAPPNVPVTFDGSGSTDNGVIADYAWEFGDGASANGAIVDHSYTSPGLYVVVLTVTDEHGNANATNVTITVGSSTLVAEFTVEPTMGKPGTAFRFNASASHDRADPNATVEVRWDWESDGIFDTPWSIEKVADHSYGSAGEYTVVLQVRTLAGDANETSGIVLVDGTAPHTTVLLDGVAGRNGWFLSQVDVSLVAVDDASGVASTTYRLDGGVWEPWDLGAVGIEGAHVLEFYSEDAVGNVESVQSEAFGIDTVAPETGLTVEANSGRAFWYAPPVFVTLSSIDTTSGVAEVSYRLDGGPWQTAPLSFTINEDGVHVLEYHATDVAGNVEALRSFEIKADGTPPTTTVATEGSAGRESWFTSDVTVTLEAVDLLSGVDSVQYRIDAGVWSTYAGPFVVSEGIHSIEYKSTDVAGNLEAPHSLALRVDRTPPTLAISPVPAIVTSTAVTIEWSGTDAPSGIGGYDWSLDGGPFQSIGSGTRLTVSLGEGEHSLTVRASDVAGNDVVQTIRFRVDTNVFSLTGPYSGAPTFAVIVVLVAVVVYVIWRRRVRRPPG